MRQYVFHRLMLNIHVIFMVVTIVRSAQGDRRMT
jgi:hypothetical protein